MASQKKSAAECRQWMQKVHTVQQKRTPEACDAARTRIEEARQHEVLSKKCKAMSSHAVRSRALAAEGLRQMSCSAAPLAHMAVQQRWQAAQNSSSERQQMALRKAELAYETDEVALMESDEEEEAMAEAAAMVGASDARSMALLGTDGMGSNAATAPGTRASSTVEELLKQLKKEPQDEAECTAKFMLYEGYSTEVQEMRSTLLKFYEESRPSLPQNLAVDMDKQITGIDSTEAMGIPDESREWFVYHMMRQAERNNLRMARILETFQKKLEFLASNNQAECPVCLEPFEGGLRCETLSCCHKVCAECWETWSTVLAGRPFCPLCRHNDFLGALTAHLATP